MKIQKDNCATNQWFLVRRNTRKLNYYYDPIITNEIHFLAMPNKAYSTNEFHTHVFKMARNV